MTASSLFTERRVVALASLFATWLFFFEYFPPLLLRQMVGDISGYHYPLLAYAFNALSYGRFPEWDPTIYCGLPFAANIQVGLFYPPNWLMFAVNWGRDHFSYISLEAFVVLHIWLAFFLCYVWMRARKLSGLAAVLGAAVFAYGGYFISESHHVGEVMGLAWLPFGLLGLDEAVERRGWRPLWKTAAASALCFLAGFPANWVAVCVILVAYALAGPGRWRAGLGAVAAIAASIPLVMVQLWPMAEASSLKTFDPKYGLGVRDAEFYLAYFIPNYFDLNHHFNGWGFPPGSYFYLGAAALFGFLWLAWRRNLRANAQALAIIGVCLFAVLNPFLIVLRALEKSELLIQMCHSWNFLAGLSIGSALVAAVAIDDFLKRGSRPLPGWLTWGAGAALLAWTVRQFVVWLPGGAEFPARWHAAVEPAIMAALLALGLFTLRAQCGRRRTALTAVLLLAVFVDYKVFGTSRGFNSEQPLMDTLFNHWTELPGVPPSIYANLLEWPEYRITGDEDASIGSGDYRHYGLSTPQGFDPLIPKRFKSLIETYKPFRTDRDFSLIPEYKSLLQRLGVRYFLTTPKGPSRAKLDSDPDFRLMHPADGYYQVFEYLNAKSTVQWNGPVKRLSWTPERREYRIGSDNGGRLAFLEQNFPGWHATIDGRPVKIEPWDGTFQSIVAPPGQHTVVFEYSPASLRWGAVISLASLAALILAVRRSPVAAVRQPETQTA